MFATRMGSSIKIVFLAWSFLPFLLASFLFSSFFGMGKKRRGKNEG